MGISITYFFGLRMGVGMGMVFVYNQLLISVGIGSLKIVPVWTKLENHHRIL